MGRADAIKKYLNDSQDGANPIYQQLNMPTVSYQDYIMGAPLPRIPTTKPEGLAMTDAEYAALKVKHGAALEIANGQRAAARGDYVHNLTNDYSRAHGYQYFPKGSIDLKHTTSGLWFEVMVEGSWEQHSTPSFRKDFWRAITYTRENDP